MLAAPMGSPDLTSEGHYMPEAIAFYELLAKGGAASVCCTEGIVHPTGKSHTRMLDMQSDSVISSLTKAARGIKKHGAAAVLELSHGGKYTSVDHVNAVELRAQSICYGPSAETLPGGIRIREMPKTLLHEIADAFGKASGLARRAGFDMILIHAGHGWLLHQFLQSADNRRTDEYGGGILNRSRLLLEVLESVRHAVGAGFPIEVRISAEDYRKNGDPFSDTVKVAELIDGKVDLIHVTTGTRNDSYDRTHPSAFYPRGCNVQYASVIKQHVKTPVATVGALNEPEMMEEILATGKADVVEMARALLADSFLPKKVLTGKDDEVMKCIRCFTCTAERTQTKTRRCSVNPVIGNETEHPCAFPTAAPKRVAVVGGGPSGMKAALTAAERGHAVTLYEKNAELGGALRCERKIPFKQDCFDIIRTLELQMKKAGVRVLKAAPFTPEIAEETEPDAVILAVGAEPILPPIPGIEDSRVVFANALSDADAAIGDEAVVLGGGLVGCETAVYLALEGKRVTVVEMRTEIAHDANIKYGPILKDKIKAFDVKTLTETEGIEIRDKGLVVRSADMGKQTLAADTIVVAAGQRALRRTVEILRDSAPIVICVGDCVVPKNIAEAMSSGYYAGLDV
jgi:2,4-dienoyl-CoA reductase-like NADH-dependent reductase (Old Yellow Enzyme family)/thioredoxin reductase